jgi:hypothetical protein
MWINTKSRTPVNKYKVSYRSEEVGKYVNEERMFQAES